MAKKQRLVVKKPFVSKTGVEVTEHYCRKCRETKRPNLFFTAVDFYLDSSGLLSVCKECVQNIYDASLIRERTINKTILDVCRTLNIRFEENVVESVMGQIRNAEQEDKKQRPVMSTYLSRLKVMIARDDVIGDPADFRLTFLEPSSVMTTPEDEALESKDSFWGEKIPIDDVEFLEREYQRFREGYSSETYTETVLLKQVCYKLLAIKEAKESEEKSLGKLEKELLVLFKDLAISPAHANASSSGAMKDAMGVWVEEIEKYTPAEWLELEDRSMFRDIDNVELYFQNYIVRPIKNFITGHPDYNLISEDDFVEIDDGDDDYDESEKLSIE